MRRWVQWAVILAAVAVAGMSVMGEPRHSSADGAPAETPYYVSDSATVAIAGPQTVVTPGVLNTDRLYAPGERIVASFEGGEFGFLPLAAAYNQGINVDVQLGVYDVRADGVRWTGQALGFNSPFGGAANGLLLNATTGTGYSVAQRRPARPVFVSGTCPRTATRCGVGAVVTFFSDAVFVVQYQYALEGELR